MSAYEKYKPQDTSHQPGEQCGNSQSVMTTFEKSNFKPIIEKWNTMTIDCFAYYKSSKCSRFDSNYLHLPIKVEDVFTQYWLRKACLNVSHTQPETNLEILGF